MSSDLILVGSAYFFSCYQDFSPKDHDYVILVDNPSGFNFVRQTRSFSDLFEWKRLTPVEYIDYALKRGPAMQIGKFLVPEFCHEINFTLSDLKQLESLFYQLDDRHLYELDIYNAYLENNAFSLTDAQRLQAYNTYKKYRNKATI